MRKIHLIVSASKGALPVLLNKRAVRRYAVNKAVAINARDAAYRFRAAELWNQLNIRGMTLMNRRTGASTKNVHAGWGVAAGS